MKTLLASLVGATAFLSLAYAHPADGWGPDYKPFKASYSIYSGEPGDRIAPTKKDRKLAIYVEGPTAKEIFESIYPDAKVTCSEEQGERLRRKGEVWCIFQPRTGYRCFMGFDLRTGASLSGTSC